MALENNNNPIHSAEDAATKILQRMRELAITAAQDTTSDSERAQLDEQLQQLKVELARLAEDS